MKILYFSARRVHGHYNFDITFNRDTNFLIGINGSGKTSALRLIQAALTIDLVTLLTIKFSKLALTFEQDGKQHTIAIINEGSTLAVYFNGVPADSKIRFLNDDERRVFTKSDRLDDYYEESRLEFLRSINDESRRLISGDRPLFLGLERRALRYDDESVYSDEQRKLVIRHPAQVRSEISESLEKCARLIETAYKQYRKISDISYNRLIKVLIASTFDYIEFDGESWPASQKSAYLELQELLVRREELERFAYSFGEDVLFGKTIEAFFQKITTLINNSIDSYENAGFSIELLMNKVQIQRFQKIFAELDLQKRNAEKAFAPIRGFVDSMNRFFESSRKMVNIDDIGRLRVTNYGESVPLNALSSGEKQLIILMAHTVFGRNKGGVIIVDEPELSLHLRWQEMLIEELIQGNKNNQLIFATHSPEIVGYMKENCIQVA